MSWQLTLCGANFPSIEFLRTSAQDGTIKEDDKESLDVAGVYFVAAYWVLC